MSITALPWVSAEAEPAGIPGVGVAGVFRGGEDHVIDTYNHALRSGGLDTTALDVAAAQLGLPLSTVFAAVTTLVELRLLLTDGGSGNRLVAMDPQLATAQLVSPIEQAIRRQRVLADQLRERISTIAEARQAPVRTAGMIDGLTGTEIADVFTTAAGESGEEIVLLLAEPTAEALSAAIVEACSDALRRGVAVRLVCPHRSRAEFGARARITRLVNEGAEIRTVSNIRQASAVFDRATALVVGLPTDGVATARRVCDREIVEYLGELFDRVFDDASAFVAEEIGYDGEVADDLQRSIAKLMAQGLTDEVVARRLGMSVRTCRRHIAALLRSLDSVSRFQAGVQAGMRLTAQGAVGA